MLLLLLSLLVEGRGSLVLRQVRGLRESLEILLLHHGGLLVLVPHELMHRARGRSFVARWAEDAFVLVLEVRCKQRKVLARLLLLRLLTEQRGVLGGGFLSGAGVRVTKGMGLIFA